MTLRSPIEFVRQLAAGRTQRAGNRVQLEDATAAAITAANPLPVDANLPDPLPVDANLPDPLPIEDTWEVILLSDRTGNNSNKTFNVPATYQYQILTVRVELTTTNAGAARQLSLEFRNTLDDVFAEYRPRVTQAVSLTYNYEFGTSLALDTAVYDINHVTTPIPPGLILPPEFDIHVYDRNAIAVNTDDMIVHILVGRKAA